MNVFPFGGVRWRVPAGIVPVSSMKACYGCYGGSRMAFSVGGSGAGSSNGPRGDEEEYQYDPMEGVQRDAARESARKSADALLRQLLPAYAPPSAFTKAQQYLLQHPIDGLITASKVHVTHIANDKGEEVKANMPPCGLDSALQRASDLGLNLVQMGGKDDTAFCRIRDEKPHILQLVRKELEAAEASASASAGQQQRRKKETLQHVFRDVVDAHFIGWKSKKIVQDIQKGHPVKLVIREFQSWEGAILKLQEMCRAMQKVAETQKIPHHFTSINANSTEVSIQFSPPVGGGSDKGKVLIKYPMEKEWSNAKKRMEEACRKSGRLGTYVKAGAMKPRSLGETTYRVDKYGRRIE